MRSRDGVWTQRIAQNCNIALLCKILLICLAVLGYLSLFIQLAHYLRDPDLHYAITQDYVDNECDCGTSVLEARSLGCLFNALASAWLPPECRDDKLTPEFNRSGPGPGGSWSY
ncbi:hypothetical protein GQ53DRAFT_742973 [Thozetella sp. PMI_491]|nr:hypothetical protein GQ53DRAFT_742973 [Thozetella sp. PMI_491]